MSLPLSSLLAVAGLPALAENPEITAITADSRQVKPGTLFVAVPGVKTDGRTFIATAVQNGATAVLAPTNTPWPENVPVRPLVLAPNPRHALALMASLLAGPQPQHLVAITGTNGKTSTADFIRQIWTLQGFKAAAIGTLGLTGAENTAISFPALTTPDPVALANGLAALAQSGFDHVALEASSHGLEQGRLDGLHLAAAGFTNLTRDHLDYHLTLEAYRAAKLKLFDTLLPEHAIAAANADMDAETLAAIQSIASRRKLQLRLVGEQGTTLRLVAHHALPAGQELTIQHNGRISTVLLPIPGRFQADNVLLAVALAAQDNAEIAHILPLLTQLRGVRGRLERATVLPNGACAYVDYAHTPDALARLLASLRPHARGRLIVVLGAGGDRDSGKRPLMGQEAVKGADIAIITDDNPRTENPASIRADIKAGAPQALEIADRKQAIAEALSMLKTDDVLVVAGKGHEQGQIIGNTILPFDDAAVLRTLAGCS
ncbi:UDP-N-acetylmuramoylalanyl-D-glutamate--2,6-diaminopimelate ligase [Acetobacter aceti 1023]|nr:UDP-N-acetylmuramoylalanyl-D-glutamate--2,6-diaminopimelate ligase [Acetobacter aceti 1023]